MVLKHKSIVTDANTPLKIVDFIGFYTVFFTSRLYASPTVVKYSVSDSETPLSCCSSSHIREEEAVGETNSNL